MATDKGTEARHQEGDAGHLGITGGDGKPSESAQPRQVKPPGNPALKPKVSFKPGLMKTSDIVVGKRFRKDATVGLESLVKSIRTVGLLHPPVVTADGLLVVGQRRIEALKALGKKRTPVRIVENLDDGLLLAERDENVERKDLSPMEALALRRAIEPALKEEAKERQREGGRRKRGRRKGGRSSPKLRAVKTREGVAAATGKSPRTMAKIEKVADSGDPALIDEMEKTGKVDRAYKKLEAKTATLDSRIEAIHSALTKLEPEVKNVVGEVVDGALANQELVARFARLLAGFGALGKNLKDASTAPSKSRLESTSERKGAKSTHSVCDS